MAGDDYRRRELADFLRTRRKRLHPESFGLPAGTRRRTEGLRREEVASLLGVSPSWYTKFEQGLDITISARLLRKLADTLRLTPVERSQLFRLGVVEMGDSPPADPDQVLPALQRIIDSLPASPAFILSPCADYISNNAASRALFGDLDVFVGRRGNQLLSLFLEDINRQILPNWEDSVRQHVAMFRSAYARHAHDGRFHDLVTLLQAESEEFRTIWEQYELPSVASRRVDYQVRPGPVLSFEYFTFFADLDASFRVEIYTPLQEGETVRYMEDLLREG